MAVRVSVGKLLVAKLLLIAVMMSACSDSDTGAEPTPDTTAPTISLSASSNLLLSDGNVLYTADAVDNEGVALVEFHDGASTVGSDDTAPFELDVAYTETDNGQHHLWATAEDDAGNTASSDTVSVIVAINVSAEFVNPGFTDNADGWTLYNFDQWSGWTDEAGNPPGCMRLNEYGTCEVDPGLEQEVSGFVPGLTYEITGEYRPYVNWIGNQFKESFVVTVDSVAVGSFPRGPNGDDWSPFTAEFTATEFIHTIGFWAEYNCDDSSYELDNVAIAIKAD